MASSEVRISKDVESGKIYLAVNGQRRAYLEVLDGGKVVIQWMVYGRLRWPEAKDMIDGLLQLSVLAEQLEDAHEQGK